MSFHSSSILPFFSILFPLPLHSPPIHLPSSSHSPLFILLPLSSHPPSSYKPLSPSFIKRNNNAIHNDVTVAYNHRLPTPIYENHPRDKTTIIRAHLCPSPPPLIHSTHTTPASPRSLLAFGFHSNPRFFSMGAHSPLV